MTCTEATGALWEEPATKRCHCYSVGYEEVKNKQAKRNIYDQSKEYTMCRLLMTVRVCVESSVWFQTKFLKLRDAGFVSEPPEDNNTESKENLLNQGV